MPSLASTSGSLVFKQNCHPEPLTYRWEVKDGMNVALLGSLPAANQWVNDPDRLSCIYELCIRAARGV